MELHVTSQEAAASLEELLDRVSGGDTTVVIEREGKPPVHLISPSSGIPEQSTDGPTGTMADLVEMLRAWPRHDDGWAEGVEEAVRLGNRPMSAEDPWDR